MENRLEYIFTPKVHNIFNHFTTLLGIRIAFFNPVGDECCVGLDKDICSYCSYLRSNIEFDNQCKQLDRQMRLVAKDTKKIVSYQCHGGLQESIMPIFWGDMLLGYIMIGQYRMQDDFSVCEIQYDTTQYDFSRLNLYFNQVPYYSKQKVKSILEIFASLVDFIVSSHFIKLKDPNLLQPLILYMYENVHKKLTLSDAAQFLNKSESRVCHMFKEMYKKSFFAIPK